MDGLRIPTAMFEGDLPAEGERFALEHRGHEAFYEIHDDVIKFCGEEFDD